MRVKVSHEKEIQEKSAPEEPVPPSQNEPEKGNSQEEILDRPPAGGVYWEE